MDPLTLLIVVVLLVFLFGGPYYGYRNDWGTGPSGLLGLVVLIVLLYVLFGHHSLGRL